MYDSGMQGAIYNGIYTLQSSIPFNCPTVHCRWDAYETFGVCSSCQNLTGKVQIGYKDESCVNQSDRVCTSYTESRYITTKGSLLLAYSDKSMHTRLNVTASPGFIQSTNNTSTINMSTILDLAAITFPEIERNLNRTNIGRNWQTNVSSAQIWECSLTWCGKAYPEINVLNGSIIASAATEIALSKEFNRDRDIGVTFPEHNYLIPTNDSKYTSLNSTLRAVDMEATERFLTSLFTVDQYIERDPRTGEISIAYALWKADNIPGTMSAIANSMTNYIRNSVNSTRHYGEAYVPQTYISVHWPWLILPVSLVVLAAILLLASIVLSRGSRTPLWKSSTIPFLFHGLEHPQLQRHKLDELSEMERLVKGIHTQLENEASSHLRFVKA